MTEGNTSYITTEGQTYSWASTNTLTLDPYSTTHSQIRPRSSGTPGTNSVQTQTQTRTYGTSLSPLTQDPNRTTSIITYGYTGTETQPINTNYMTIVGNTDYITTVGNTDYMATEVQTHIVTAGTQIVIPSGTIAPTE